MHGAQGHVELFGDLLVTAPVEATEDENPLLAGTQPSEADAQALEYLLSVGGVFRRTQGRATFCITANGTSSIRVRDWIRRARR